MTRRARAVMVCGTTSGAGKSLVTTALARWYAREGFKVAPFKSQNMSNNARVVEGGEMGSAQYFQALAARAVPEVRMNPVLLKPEKDTQSQVIVLGQPAPPLAALDWRARADELWPVVQRSLDALRTEYELVVIEGAGSPAEINLHATDIVNMRIARAAGAATLLVCDIDRGGAFAHLYGTHQLLPADERALIRGFVLNKFRGDPALLPPGPDMLERLTGVPTIGVLPMWREHGLPDEDGVFDAAAAGAGFAIAIAIVAYPRISNLDEFAPLRRVPGVSLAWARRPETLAAADLVILPGSKHVADDLAWLRAERLDAALAAHIAAGKPTLAVCGGLQMLGRELLDPDGVEGAALGLGVLPLVTEYHAEKCHRRGRYTFGALEGFWAPLSGHSFAAYEIRHGRSERVGGSDAALRAALPDGGGWQQGATLALYTHGLFEDAGVLKALFGHATPSLEETFDGLADFVDRHIGRDRLLGLLG